MKSKNLFVVRFGVGLWLTSIGLGSAWVTLLTPVVAFFLGDIIDRGILKIDLTLDSLRLALSKDEFMVEAKKAYEHASARVYTELEKKNIREEYLRTLNHFAINGVPNG